jgi:hypothetical protein
MKSEQVLAKIKSWLESNVEAELHEKDLVQDNKDLLLYIDKWEKNNAKD